MPSKLVVIAAFVTAAACASSPPTVSEVKTTGPATAEAHVLRSETLCRSGRTPECVRELDEAIRIAGADARLLKLRGGAKFQNDDYPGAAADYTAVIERDAHDGRAFLLRALSRSLLNPPDRAGACADLDSARKLGVDVRGRAGGVVAWCERP